MTRSLTLAALMVAVAALGLLNLHLLLTPIEIGALPLPGSGPAVSPSTIPAAPARFRLDGTTPTEFPETTSRPLFWSSRRPMAPAPLEPATQQRPVTVVEIGTDAFRLAGILHGDGNKPRALIVWPQQPTGRWMEAGAEIDGWRVTWIKHHAVGIEAGMHRRELKMH